MPSAVKFLEFTTSHDDHKIALLAALAISIHIVESTFPSPIPGMKPGLANVITLFTFLHFGWKTALQVSLLRVLIGSLLLGTFLSPTFMLSFSGAFFSLLVLGVLALFFKAIPALRPTAFGFAIAAAIAHILGQFLVAWYFFIPHPGLFTLLPVFITFAVILGLVSGIITQFLTNAVMVQDTKNV
jgi:heptaprenyl diphosphate synthase